MRALGYRVDRRPRPLEAASASPTEAGPAEEGAAEQALAPQDTTDASTAEELGAVAQSEPVEAATEAVVEPVTVEPEFQPDSVVEAQTSEVTASPEEVATEQAVTSEPQAGEAGLDEGEKLPEAEASSEETPDPAAAAEPEFIEIWRPGRSEERRPRRRRPARDRKPAESPAQTPAPAQATAEVPSSPPQRDEPRRDREDRRKPRDAADRGAGRSQEGRREGRDRDRRRDRRDEDRPPRVWEAGRDRRGKEPDPDSPFAKLAALKAQLEAEAKDRH